jgi:hypothetical protein
LNRAIVFRRHSRPARCFSEHHPVGAFRVRRLSYVAAEFREIARQGRSATNMLFASDVSSHGKNLKKSFDKPLTGSNKAAKRNMIAWRLCRGGPGHGEIVRCGDRSAFTRSRNKTRLLSLMSALRVNSGTRRRDVIVAPSNLTDQPYPPRVGALWHQAGSPASRHDPDPPRHPSFPPWLIQSLPRERWRIDSRIMGRFS